MSRGAGDAVSVTSPLVRKAIRVRDLHRSVRCSFGVLGRKAQRLDASIREPEGVLIDGIERNPQAVGEGYVVHPDE